MVDYKLKSALVSGLIIGVVDYIVWVYYDGATTDLGLASIVGLATAALAYWGMKR